MRENVKTLKFKFYSMTDIVKTSSRSITELYFNEHFDELRQRVFHILSFLSLITFFTFYNVKLLVKILESPVSNIQFFQLSPGEYFVSTLIISFYAGVLFSTPLLLSQTLFFFRPALTKNEKNIIVGLLVSSIVLFVLGLLFSYFLLIPAALNFFIFYGAEVIEPFWSFTQYFNFVSTLFFSTGLVFQVPIVQIILSLSKIVDPIKMLNYWRPMILFSTILGAVLTPSADPITQLLLSGALFLLYFLGSITSINLVKREVI
uniref:Sec-independent protein translocase component TatC n=1 Tax=Laminaria rodriguezii TaxID=1740620 RepID=A0A7U1AQM0_9PHAE|nr:Sec-independent protein translocase component TatC [Laminaria rodriguezii]QQY85121.1 Sec-independent protein translocase component TatC [Laminaria rodriguezii]